MFRKAKFLGVPIVALLFFSACTSEFKKAFKSNNADLKYETAVKYYEEEDYVRAYQLFDQLLVLYRGNSKAEEVYYYYAYCNYGMGDYLLAAYHFKNYVRTFKAGKHNEEMAYMAAYCYYLESPVYKLDQTSTYDAIEQLQSFVNKYPNSERLEKCNELIQELRDKLERKSYETGKMYYKTGYYQAALVSFDNTLNEFPDTEYREELMFLKLRAAYEIAINSVESKKDQRLDEAQTAYAEFVVAYPESKSIAEAEKLLNRINNQMNLINNQLP